jgi:hypothetical protein
MSGRLPVYNIQKLLIYYDDHSLTRSMWGATVGLNIFYLSHKNIFIYMTFTNNTKTGLDWKQPNAY